jgi:hypothetical protein
VDAVPDHLQHLVVVDVLQLVVDACSCRPRRGRPPPAPDACVKRALPLP